MRIAKASGYKKKWAKPFEKMNPNDLNHVEIPREN
jgi:hypothetical protein